MISPQLLATVAVAAAVAGLVVLRGCLRRPTDARVVAGFVLAVIAFASAAGFPAVTP